MKKSIGTLSNTHEYINFINEREKKNAKHMNKANA